MNFIKIFFLGIICSFLLISNINALENKILFKVNNEIITSLDIFNELRYLEEVNKQFKNVEKKQAFEIAKRSLIREKIKEIELIKLLQKIEVEDKFLNNLLINLFKLVNVKTIEDLHEGLILPGLVTNVTNFGAFVNIGIKNEGLVHISHIANKFIKHPSEVLSVQDEVKVKVVSVDLNRNRVQLSIKEAQ